MSLFIIILCGVLGVPVTGIGIYFVALLLAAVLRRRGKRMEVQEKARVAVVIPAHNEEALIGDTILSVLEADYPQDKVSVFVIADNCTDRTAQLAKQMGVRVAQRSNRELVGKGYALDWFLRSHREELAEFEIVVLIDADTLIDPAFLDEVNREMATAGVDAVQGYYGVANLEAGWRAQMCEIAFAVAHHLRPLGRNALGSTAGLKGNGMAFRTSLLLELGWPAHGLVEDLEMGVLLAERGVRVRYVPKAVIRAEMVVRPDAAKKQRLRWEGGRRALVKGHGARLLRGFLQTGRWELLECWVDLVVPPLGMCAKLSIAALATGLAVSSGWLIGSGAAVIGAMVAFIFAGLVDRRAPATVWRTLVFIPWYVLWKALIVLHVIRHGTGLTWQRTERICEGSDGRQSRYQKYVLLGKGNPRKWARDWEKALRRWKAATELAEVCKRCFDLVAATAALMVLGPVMLATALLIKLEDGGPVLFRQTRAGKDGKPFTLFKFRSMVVNAEKIRESLDEQNEHDLAVTFKMKKDPRITRVGGFIRRFSIDEMPQFLNVLKGDMSVIGPRPALYREIVSYDAGQLRRLSAKPGISCLWQVQGRADIDFDGQVRLDLEYIHSETLWRDIVILLKTVPAVVLAKGAY